MQQEFDAKNFDDTEGHPAGGYVHGVGLVIEWQNGPLGKGEDRIEPNGAFVETVIAAALQRIKYYQSTQFACHENGEAIAALETALSHLNVRTANREHRGVEGTHEV